MKKLLIILGLFVFLLIGIELGSNTPTNKNIIIEEAKDRFEEEIIKENNDYQNVLLAPDDNAFNYLAKRIDKTINKVMDKIKSLR